METKVFSICALVSLDGCVNIFENQHPARLTHFIFSPTPQGLSVQHGRLTCALVQFQSDARQPFKLLWKQSDVPRLDREAVHF